VSVLVIIDSGATLILHVCVLYRCVRGVLQSVHGCSDVSTRGGFQTRRRTSRVDVLSQSVADTTEAAAEVWCSVHARHPRRRIVKSKTFMVVLLLKITRIVWHCFKIISMYRIVHLHKVT